MTLLLLACADQADTHRSRPSPKSTEEAGCVDTGPCSAALATATWAGSLPGGWTGYEVAAGSIDGTDVVLVGTPAYDPAEVAALAPADLDWIGTWSDLDPDGSGWSSLFGVSVAFATVVPRIAVGASDGGQSADQEGIVYVFDSLPDGFEAHPRPVLTLNGDQHNRGGFGAKVLYADFTGAGEELVVGTGGVDSDIRRLPNGVFRYAPDLEGMHGQDVAVATIRGEPFFGQYLAAWDADRDGLDELVSHADEGVLHFQTPWSGNLTQDDADVLIAERDPVDQFGTTLENVGDLDGDGGAELAIGANTYSATIERQGGLWLLPAGALAPTSSEDLPYAFHGLDVGDGVGSSAASGDFDGDGATDLVVGAYGLVPGAHAGKALGYLGPLAPGVRMPADADFVMHGEQPYDWFGADMVTIRADDDAADDLVVSAQGWEGVGKVYLFLGPDLVR